jgi:hypothetical protein
MVFRVFFTLTKIKNFTIILLKIFAFQFKNSYLYICTMLIGILIITTNVPTLLY